MSSKGSSGPGALPAPPEGSVEVGIVRHHFFQHHAIGVVVTEGQQIERGSVLYGVGFSPDRQFPVAIQADSIELNHHPIAVGTSGQEIGISMDPPFFPKGTKLVKIPS